VCQEALAWQARALAGLPCGQLDRGICGTQALPQGTGLGVARCQSLRLVGRWSCYLHSALAWPGRPGWHLFRWLLAGQPLVSGLPGVRPLPSPLCRVAIVLGLAQPEGLPIPGKKRTEKWQLPSGPRWPPSSSSSSRRRAGVRTGKRVAGPRRRRRGCGVLRRPAAPGAQPGLRARAQVSSSPAGRPTLAQQAGRGLLTTRSVRSHCPPVGHPVRPDPAPSTLFSPDKGSSVSLRSQGSLHQWSCEPGGLFHHWPSCRSHTPKVHACGARGSYRGLGRMGADARAPVGPGGRAGQSPQAAEPCLLSAQHSPAPHFEAQG